MLSPLKGGSGLKAKRKKSLFQSLGVSATRPPHIKKIDRCFWGISDYDSIPGMIPKSNARKCNFERHCIFFLLLLALGPGVKPGESSFGTVYLI